MKANNQLQKWITTLTIIILYFKSCHAVEPFSTFMIASGVLSSIGTGYYFAKCKVVECCDSDWISPNMTGLTTVLRTKLHGQHLVIDTLIKTLRGHVYDPNPTKALVLSMHGWTGGGKNYVSRFIADHLYAKGLHSAYVHLFVATLHFPHESKLELYKDQLSSWIRGNVTECPRSMFIFDEMDKLPKGLIDTIKPFIDTHSVLDKADFRKTIFLFLSNSAGNDITKKTYEHWKAGKPREELSHKEIENVIQMSSYNEEGGLYKANILEKHLVSAFVPFLPMERQHVKKCIRDDLKLKGHPVTDKIINSVADELQYFPADAKLYSTSGCKRVSEKVNFIMEEV